MISKVSITNFKSISNELISLGRFNVLVGANASGKSNFVDSLRFVHDILSQGLAKSVSHRIGWHNVLRRGLKTSEKITADIFCNLKETDVEFKFQNKITIPHDVNYHLGIGYSNKRAFLNSERLECTFQGDEETLEESFVRTRKTVKIKDSVILGGESLGLKVIKQQESVPFIHSFFLAGSSFFNDFIRGWRFYDFDVDAARKPCIDEGQNVLSDDGHDLAVILDKLKPKASTEIRDRILRIMSILIPGFKSWKAVRQPDDTLSYKIYEEGIDKPFVPKMVSDGTIRLLCIIVGLIHQPPGTRLICIDEPERYLHPQVLETLVEIMRDVSEHTQIVVTTHSAELVKWLKPSEVLMVEKIDNLTHIVPAMDISMIDQFLEELSLDELWLGGYLKGEKAH